MITTMVEALPLVAADMRAAIETAPRTSAQHRELLGDLPALNAVQRGGRGSKAELPSDFTIVAWNVERCLFPEASAAHLSDLAPDVVLLSEVDHGMSRTAQRHTTADFAAAMDMSYIFGVEFFELGLGGSTERSFCKDNHNALGWHGNAILSSVSPTRSAMIRLDSDGHWFAGPQADPEQPRIGGRMALLAELPVATGPVTVVSTHLESNAGAAHRHAQFENLLDAIDDFSPDNPVVIGGDLNTGNHLPPDFDWRRETLFDLGRTRGFDWSFTADGVTTRPSLITPHPDREMKLDWIAARRMTCRDRGILSALGPCGTPLSDHDAAWARIQCGNSAF